MEISGRNVIVQFKNNKSFFFSPSLPFIPSQQRWEVSIFVYTFALLTFEVNVLNILLTYCSFTETFYKQPLLNPTSDTFSV